MFSEMYQKDKDLAPWDFRSELYLMLQLPIRALTVHNFVASYLKEIMQLLRKLGKMISQTMDGSHNMRPRGLLCWDWVADWIGCSVL